MSSKHQNNSLLISLETSSPEATHHGLCKGIINSLKFQMQSSDPISEDIKEGNVYLIELLESLMPTEKQLRKIHKPE